MTTFDSLETSRELRAAGLAEAQADAIASAIARGISEHSATKTDLELTEERLRSHALRLALALGAFLATTIGVATGAVLRAL